LTCRSRAPGPAALLLALGAAGVLAASAQAATPNLVDSQLKGNGVDDVALQDGLDINVILVNGFPAIIAVDVTNAEFSAGTIDFIAFLINDAPLDRLPSDFTGIELTLEGGATWGLIGSLRDSPGDPITSYTADDTRVSITLDPPLRSNPNPPNPECCDFLEIGSALEPGTNWEIDLGGLPPSSRRFVLRVRAVPEPAVGGAATVLATLGLLALRRPARSSTRAPHR
jgi:hypothetical protein